LAEVDEGVVVDVLEDVVKDVVWALVVVVTDGDLTVEIVE
jgi:hypothetical protein